MQNYYLRSLSFLLGVSVCLSFSKTTSAVDLSAEHIKAVHRHRRIVVNFDVIHGDRHFTTRPVPELVQHRFGFVDDPSIHIDSIWWNWGEGNQTPYASKYLPLYKHEGYQRWIDQGIDIVKVFLDETRKRNIEVFFSHRMNGSDNDLGPFEYDNLPAKKNNPHLLFQLPWGAKVWNFAHQEVHDYVIRNLMEVVEKYDFDGIDLDFARGVVFPAGEGWKNRDQLTSFVRRLRVKLLEIEQARGRPFLLSARVPQDLMGCHYDGIDVETWTGENLIDIYAIGVRSLGVDVREFRDMIGKQSIRVYVSLDDHHSADGYMWPPIEVFRGVFSNWYHQGTDGIQPFNFKYHGKPLHKQAYQEMAHPEGLRLLDKHFVLARRGGGHGTSVIPNPEDWSTPRHMYANTNMFAPLPAPLDPRGKADTLLKMYIGDDFNTESEQIQQIRLRLLLNDPTTRDLPDEKTWTQTLIRHFRGVDFLYNSPPRKGVEKRLQLRVNNILLTEPVVEDGWLVYHDVDPRVFAVGPNLVGMLLPARAADADSPMLIEKLEVHVAYHYEDER